MLISLQYHRDFFFQIHYFEHGHLLWLILVGMCLNSLAILKNVTEKQLQLSTFMHHHIMRYIYLHKAFHFLFLNYFFFFIHLKNSFSQISHFFSKRNLLFIFFWIWLFILVKLEKAFDFFIFRPWQNVKKA